MRRLAFPLESGRLELVSQEVPWSVRSLASWASVCYLPDASGQFRALRAGFPPTCPARVNWEDPGGAGEAGEVGEDSAPDIPRLYTPPVFLFLQNEENFFVFAAIKKSSLFCLEPYLHSSEEALSPEVRDGVTRRDFPGPCDLHSSSN